MNLFRNVATYTIRSEKGRIEVEKMFMNAVIIGNVTTAKSCLEKGVNPNILSSDGLSALHIAAERDDVLMGRLLMSAKNIQMNQPMSNGDTPLIHATRFRSKRFVRVLLNIGSLTNANVEQDFSTQEKVSKAHLAERKFGRMWLHRGANANCKNNMEKTALHVAAILGLLETIQDLVRGGADVNVADCFGNTPLTYCVLEHPDPQIAKFLLSKGANPNFWTCRPNALFLETALNCNSPVLLEMMQILLDYGMDVDIVNPVTQYTALHMVGISGYVPLAELLLSKGANIHARDCLRRTPYDVAVLHEHKELIRLYRSWMKSQQEKELEKEKKKQKKLTFAT